MKIKHLSILALAILAMACDKDDDDPVPPTPQVSAPSAPQPNFPNMDGAMIAISTSSVVSVPFFGEQTQFVNTGVAFFPDGSGGFFNAGDVSLEGETMSNTNNSYILTPSVTNPSGVVFDSPIDWDVTGSSDVTAFNHSYSSGVPEIGDIAPDLSEVVKADGVTFGIDMSNLFTDLNGADSIIFNVIGTGGVATKTLAANSTSATFSSSELSNIGSGAGYVQIAAYNFSSAVKSGNTIYFVNEGVFTQGVTIR